MYEENQGPPPASIGKILGVAAGKGGVGKSTVSVNLALALSELGFKVGIFDADIYGPSVRKMLPETRPPSRRGDLLIPAMSGPIKVVSIAFFRKEDEASVVRAPIANGIITQFLKQVAWGDLDYLIIDFPPGTGDIQLTLAQTANLAGALLVTTPQEVSMIDVRKAANLFHQVNIPISGVVENMSFYLDPDTQQKNYLFGKGGGAQLAKEIGVPLIGQIPVHPELSRSGDLGLSLFSYPEGSDPAGHFLFLGKRVVKSLDAVKEQRGVHPLEVKQEERALLIRWSSGKEGRYPFFELQRRCPCASCIDENTGERLVDPASVPEDQTAVRVEGVGRYGIRVFYPSGCSNGIFTFEDLHQLEV